MARFMLFLMCVVFAVGCDYPSPEEHQAMVGKEFKVKQDVFDITITVSRPGMVNTGQLFYDRILIRYPADWQDVTLSQADSRNLNNGYNITAKEGSATVFYQIQAYLIVNDVSEQTQGKWGVSPDMGMKIQLEKKNQ